MRRLRVGGWRGAHQIPTLSKASAELRHPRHPLPLPSSPFVQLVLLAQRPSIPWIFVLQSALSLFRSQSLSTCKIPRDNASFTHLKKWQY
jgi:hypothetical protein